MIATNPKKILAQSGSLRTMLNVVKKINCIFEVAFEFEKKEKK